MTTQKPLDVERLRLELIQREEMAADLTERLFQEGKRVERLREALAPLALLWEPWMESAADTLGVMPYSNRPAVGDVRRARAVLGEE